MTRARRPGPVLVEETHRATTFEIFFDLVLVFAITQIVDFMSGGPGALALFQGLLLVLWFWYAWSCYAWLGNLARADVGVVRGGMILAMAAIFVAATVIPDAWQDDGGAVKAPLIVALAYTTIRMLHLALMFAATATTVSLRRQALRFAVPTMLAWAPMIVGAALGGTVQTLLWAAAFVIDYGGGRIATAASLGEVRSAAHFAERHGLVLIIALGESLLSVGAGARTAFDRGPVLGAALLGFAATLCLWWLYFQDAAPAADRALSGTPSHTRRRQQLASDAYTLAHLPLIAGVIYFALGIHQVLTHVVSRPTGHPGGTPLGWASTSVLCGGVAAYLLGRFLFLRLTVGTSPAQLVAVGLTLLLIPVARNLPALAAIGLLTAFLVVLVCYERLTGVPRPEGT